MAESLILVERFLKSDQQTLGKLSVINSGQVTFTCLTQELPWKDNQQRISCIPIGNYRYGKNKASTKVKYPHVDIYDVPNRGGVKIHAGNYVTQILGCIEVGKEHLDINKDGLNDVTESRVTLKALLKHLTPTGSIQISET